MSHEIIEAYHDLSKSYEQEYTDVTERSSAKAEDLLNARFASQQETYLNVRGATSLIDAVRNCFASLSTDRAISYREDFKFDHLGIAFVYKKWRAAICGPRTGSASNSRLWKCYANSCQ